MNQLNQDEAKQVKEISSRVIASVSENSVQRCTFFTHDGIEGLIEAVNHCANASNPRVEACDDNPFNQHYWLAFDLDEKHIVVDPIFGYFGVIEQAPEKNRFYYDDRRIVDHTKPYWEGGIRVKTISL